MKNLLLALFFLSFAGQSTGQTWMPIADMPTPRHGIEAITLDDFIYVPGGSTSNGQLKVVEVYSPQTNSWKTASPLNIERCDYALAAVNGKVYIIGGYNNTSNRLNSVEEYDPATNVWTLKAPMPTTRSEMSCAVVNGKIYVIGGGPGDLAVVEVYDPVTDSWSNFISCSLGRQQSGGAKAIGNKIYFYGGKNNSGNFYSYTEMFDFATLMWTQKANMPAERFAGASAVIAGDIHFVGGATGDYTPNYNNYYIYNPVANTWSTGVPMLYKRSRNAAASLGKELFVFGGWSENNTVMASSEKLTVQTGSGIYTPNINSLNLYPNPGHGQITIEGNFAGKINIVVINTLGQKVTAKNLTAQQGKVVADFSDLADGLYHIQLTDDHAKHKFSATYMKH